MDPIMTPNIAKYSSVSENGRILGFDQENPGYAPAFSAFQLVYPLTMDDLFAVSQNAFCSFAIERGPICDSATTY